MTTAALGIDEMEDPALRRRQKVAVLKLELLRTLFGKRSFVVYLLALMPLGFLTLRAIAILRGWLRTGENPEIFFAGIYQVFFLRFAIFFGCAWTFTNLLRGEILDRSLHYYYLCPIRRETLIAFKYVAGLLATMLIFVSSTVLAYVLLWLPYRAEGMDHLLVDPGLARIFQYAAVTTLGCVGYGAAFLLTGTFFRNPMIPAVVLWGWEFINWLLPPILKKLSVIHYLLSLCPVKLSQGNFAFIAEPTPWYLSAPGLLALTGVVLWVAMRRARRSEILYGSD